MVTRDLALFSRPVMKAAVIAVFTALSLGTNYAMIDFPNVKIMDALVFLAAFLFGLGVGLSTAVSTWLIYGFVNPYGQDSFIFLIFLITGECFYAIAGTLLSRTALARGLMKNGRLYGPVSLVFGLTGVVSTLAYDVLTNFGTYWLFTSASAYQALVIGMITGLPFAILHEGSNLVFFSTVVPVAIVASKRLGLSIKGTRV